MFAVQPIGLHSRDKELGPIRIAASIRHAQYPGTVVGELEILVGKGASVDAFTSRAVTLSKVPSLKHEIRNDAMKVTPFEVQRFSRFSGSFFARAKGTKILGCLGNVIAKQSNHDATGLLAIDRDIEVNLVRDLALGGLLCQRNRRDAQNTQGDEHTKHELPPDFSNVETSW